MLDEPEHERCSGQAIDQRPAGGMLGVEVAPQRTSTDGDQSAQRSALVGPRDADPGVAGVFCEPSVREDPRRCGDDLVAARIATTRRWRFELTAQERLSRAESKPAPAPLARLIIGLTGHSIGGRLA